MAKRSTDFLNAACDWFFGSLDRWTAHRKPAFERGRQAATEWRGSFPPDHPFTHEELVFEGDNQAAGVFFTQAMRDAFSRGWQSAVQASRRSEP